MGTRIFKLWKMKTENREDVFANDVRIWYILNRSNRVTGWKASRLSEMAFAIVLFGTNPIMGNKERGRWWI